MAEPSPKPVSVLFVCLGNICRSTMAEGVFTSLTPSHPLIRKIDSCGTGAYHISSPPDSRTLRTLKSHGITSYTHSARKFNPQRDFDEFEYILAMDGENLADLEVLRAREVRKRGEEGVGRVMLFGEFAEGKKGKGRGEEIEDPYYGGGEGFETAYKQCVEFSRVFLGRLEKGELS